MNASGNGVESDEASATPIAVPGKPTGFTASPGDGEVRLTWDDPGDAAITRWQYQQKEGAGNYGHWTNIPSSGPSTSSYTVVNLVNGARYAFKLRTVNLSGPGAESNAVTATPIAVPGMPSGFTASAGDSEVRLTWNDPGDAAITRWQYRSAMSSGESGGWTEIGNSDHETASYTVISLNNDTEYYFQVRAVNSSGAGAASSEVRATPVAAPSKVTVTAVGRDASVELTWSNPGDSTIIKWQYRSATSSGGTGGWADILSSTKDTVSHTVASLTNGQVHYFQVRAVNPSGAGAASDEASATPVAKPAKPTNFAAAAGSGEVTLTWGQPQQHHHHPLAVPAEGGCGQLRRLDRHPVQRRLDQFVHGHQSGQRYALHVQVAGGE